MHGTALLEAICREAGGTESGVLGNGRAEMDSSAWGCLQKVLLDKCCDVKICRSCCSSDNFLPIKTVFV